MKTKGAAIIQGRIEAGSSNEIYISNDIGKMKSLSHVRDQFPSIFQENGAYQVDPLSILEQNQLLLEKLEGMSAYRHLLKEKPALINVTIRQKKQSTVISLQLSPLAFREYRDGLKKRIGRSNKTPLLERILELRKRPRSDKEAMLELCELVQIFILVQGADGRISDNPRELKAAIGQVKEGRLDYFTDQVTLERKFSPLGDVLGKDKKSLLKSLIGQRMDRLMRQTVKTKKTVRQLGLVLKECTPLMGLFRGCLGQDCSTQYSSGYALSPAERIFSIWSKTNSSESKGYVAGTIVMVQGKKTLYLHTIAGPHVSGAKAKLILKGLYQCRQELGVAEIILPSKGQLENLINYLDIKNTFRNLATDGRQKRITYLDSALRKKIGKFVPPDITYDNPEENRMGYLYHPSPKELAEVSTGPSRQAYVPLSDSSFSHQEGILLALDFLRMGLREQSQRIASVFNLDLDGLLRLRR